jgi:hypothetical protein
MVPWVGSRAALLGAVTGVALAAAWTVTVLRVEARSTWESPYGFERTWNAALRLIRVDNGWNVTEKDENGGYVLFEYRPPVGSSKKTTPGSLELVRGHEPDAPIGVLAQLPQMPKLHEQVLLDSLASKMRREYGDPPVRRAPTAIPDASAGPDGGE